MFTTDVNGTLTAFPVGGTPGNLQSKQQLVRIQYWARRCREVHLQPVDLFGMCKRKDELVDNPINAHCSAHKLQFRIIGIIEDEMVPVEV